MASQDMTSDVPARRPVLVKAAPGIRLLLSTAAERPSDGKGSSSLHRRDSSDGNQGSGSSQSLHGQAHSACSPSVADRASSQSSDGQAEDASALQSAPLPLPHDLMLAIARAALAAEGHSVPAWARLSLVCKAWRRVLQGRHVVAARRKLIKPQSELCADPCKLTAAEWRVNCKHSACIEAAVSSHLLAVVMLLMLSTRCPVSSGCCQTRIFL